MLSRKQLKTIDGENKSDMKIFDAMKQYGFFKAVVAHGRRLQCAFHQG